MSSIISSVSNYISSKIQQPDSFSNVALRFIPGVDIVFNYMQQKHCAEQFGKASAGRDLFPHYTPMLESVKKLVDIQNTQAICSLVKAIICIAMAILLAPTGVGLLGIIPFGFYLGSSVGNAIRAYGNSQINAASLSNWFIPSEVHYSLA
jgi:hypothetical protein